MEKRNPKGQRNNRSLDPFYAREASKYSHPIPSREFILQHFAKVARPIRRSDLIASFKLADADAHEALRRRLNAMLRDGQIIKNRKGSYALIDQLEMIRGYVIGHRDGFGFLVPEDGSDDIFLDNRQMRLLFPGDQVVARILPSNSTHKRECVIEEILERAFTQIVGRFVREADINYIIPANKDIAKEIIIPPGKHKHTESGQMVVCKILTYPSAHCSATAEVLEVLGKYSAPGMEIEVAIRSHALPFNWSADVLKDCAALTTKIEAAERQKRHDLTQLPFVTIDGPDAKDFDDAVYCEPAKKDGWVLYVAIADVSHYVRFNSALDQEALTRGNSVYFPERVVPMLPEALSNDLCSLKPNVERLSMVCEMHVGHSGKINKYYFYDAIIKSHARLTYDEVYDFLEGRAKKTTTLLPHLREVKKVYQAFLKQRKARGALEFSQLETKIVFGKNRKIARIEPVYRHYAHDIIEECMLAANVCASEFLLSGKIPALFRVHEGPDIEKLKNLRVFLGGLGLKLGGGHKPTSHDYAKLIEEVAGRPDESLVQTMLLRSMCQAVYTPENIGHFSLAYKAYAHFTSPIRRYPDLLNHRAIRYLLHGGKVKNYGYSLLMMQKYGVHCSMTERRADDATRDAINVLKCEFMQNKIGKVFAGIISGVTTYGVFVKLQDIFVEGLLHISSLKNDYYKYDQQHNRLVGRRTRKIYRLGDKLKVKLIAVSLDERQIDFELA
jgi:ribonuclease R